MRILLIGAYGFIGSEIGRALIARGDEVIGFGRDIGYGRRILPGAGWRQGDLRNFVTPGAWLSCLDKIDAVVNASGLLQDEAAHKVATVQADAITALVGAGEAPGIGCFVQISAANAAPDAPTDFLRSKALADRAVAASSLRHAIIRPGLVIGRNAYGGTELLRAAAAIPLTGLAFKRAGRIQCTGMADLVDAVLRALDGEVASGSYDLVETDSRSLSDIVERHRAWLGFALPLWTLPVGPVMLGLFGRGADLLGRFDWRSPLRSNAIASLTRGISGDAAAATVLLGRAPRSLEAVLAAAPAGKQDRIVARQGVMLVPMLAALFLMWFGSALFTITSFQRAAGILAAGGVGLDMARLLAGAGAVVDAGLALMLLHRRTVRPALWGTVIATLAYLAGATLIRPDLWVDPLAPLFKVLPAMMLSFSCLTFVERR